VLLPFTVAVVGLPKYKVWLGLELPLVVAIPIVVAPDFVVTVIGPLIFKVDNDAKGIVIKVPAALIQLAGTELKVTLLTVICVTNGVPIISLNPHPVIPKLAAGVLQYACGEKPVIVGTGIV
jgi:hypothetical protein